MIYDLLIVFSSISMAAPLEMVVFTTSQINLTIQILKETRSVAMNIFLFFLNHLYKWN